MEPPRSDLGFDPRQVNPGHLHACANLTVQAVEEELSEIRDSIRLASAFLDI